MSFGEDGLESHRNCKGGRKSHQVAGSFAAKISGIVCFGLAYHGPSAALKTRFSQLPDVSKAVRIAVQFAMKESEERTNIYAEAMPPRPQDTLPTCELSIELYSRQKDFLDEAAREHKLPGPDVSTHSHATM